MIVLAPSEHPVASIVILSQDNPAQLEACLAAIARSVDPVETRYEVLVLFQQMSRESVEGFTSGVEGIRAFRSRINLGFGGGNNYAATQANGKYLVFLNDDTEPQPGWLKWLVSAADADEAVGAVGSRILFPNGVLQEGGSILWSDGSSYPLGRGEPNGSLAYSYVRPVDYVSANGLLVPRATFDAIGGYDARYFPAYYEDVDLCLMIRHNLGLRVIYEPRSQILHHESTTAKRDPRFREFLFRRNRDALRTKWAGVLPSYPVAEPQSEAAIERAVLRSRGNPARILVIDDRVPNAGLGSGFGRTVDLLRELHKPEFAVALYPSDRGNPPAHNAVAGYAVDIIAEPLAEHLARPHKHYDVVIISRPHNFHALYDTIRRAMPHVPVIYDAEALYHRRLQLQVGMESDDGRRGLLEVEGSSMLALEADIARTADYVVAISESERDWLLTIDGHAPIELMRPLARASMTPPALERRSNAVFVSGWLGGENSPNVGALRWYVREVLPRVRAALPHFSTLVTGGNPPLSVQCMAGNGVVLAGYVASIAELYGTARVAIAPILAGAGVKIKTIEALQFGVPVIATPVGAEGLGVIDQEGIDIAGDPSVFAERLIALATDDALWRLRRQQLERQVGQWEGERIQWDEVVERALARSREAAALA